jgi:EAL domain-containing protein (putative c-di-GMP-specific phosphodiesterase class I)
MANIRAIIQAIIQMGRPLVVRVAVESVKRKEQETRFSATGCGHVQRYR